MFAVSLSLTDFSQHFCFSYSLHSLISAIFTLALLILWHMKNVFFLLLRSGDTKNIYKSHMERTNCINMQFHEVLWAAFTNATEHARFIYDFHMLMMACLFLATVTDFKQLCTSTFHAPNCEFSLSDFMLFISLLSLLFFTQSPSACSNKFRFVSFSFPFCFR